MNEQDIEKEIQCKGLNAPQPTPELADDTTTDEQYYVFNGTDLTVCCLTSQNGFMVAGESITASLENFDAEIIQALEKYSLEQHLHEASN